MYHASENRYAAMAYRPCGKSGVRLPALALGMWQNFGGLLPFENTREMILGAFDRGIVHFDLANNYGPPFGSAEESLGRILKSDLKPYRDELFLSTKAGYAMWDGPYGSMGSKKHLIASLDQSLRRMGVDYVDVFYHHRPDPNTPLEESMEALWQIWRQGKALYVGISNYSAEETRRACACLRSLGVRPLVHQPKYSMLQREPETTGLWDVLLDEGMGAACFSPLAQGLLTGRYLSGDIPSDSRMHAARSMKPDMLTDAMLGKLRRLNAIAKARGQSLSQLALTWTLRDPVVATVIIGASRLSQIDENLGALNAPPLSAEELTRIDVILAED